MKKQVLNFMIGVFASVFVFSAYCLINYFMQIRQAEKEYSNLAQIVADAQQTEPEDPSDASTPDATGPAGEPRRVKVTDPDTGETFLCLPEYAPIYELNSDTVGWIRINGTNIDFPVLHKPEYTDYYLTRSFYHEWSNQGAIYVREQCDVTKPSDNVTIYGHRTNAGTMFAQLQKYKEQSFWEEHKNIQFDTLSSHYTYEIFSVFLIDATIDSGFQYHEFVDAEDQAQFDSFVQQCKDRSLYETGITPTYGDKLITLSTCEGSSTVGRLVVVARRLVG